MILVTGGLGYIGSHLSAELLRSGYDVIIVDNLSNSYLRVKKKIEKITKKRIKLYIANVSNKRVLRRIFKKYDIDTVIHLAGVKSVIDSVNDPISYYKNNVSETISLLSVMNEFNCKNLIFSSSATVYGNQSTQPLSEDMVKSCEELSNPYGKTKRIIENILEDLRDWNISVLRYFNVIGSHNSFQIGDDPKKEPNNLIPAIERVFKDKKNKLKIFVKF